MERWPLLRDSCWAVWSWGRAWLWQVPFPLRAAKVSCGGRHTLALVCHADELEIHRKGLRWYAAKARADAAAGKAAQQRLQAA